MLKYDWLLCLTKQSPRYFDLGEDISLRPYRILENLEG